MDPLDLIQAVSAGFCFYAGITHLIIGLRSQPRNWVHLSFAVLSLLYGVYSLNLFLLYVAFDTGLLEPYVFTDRWGIAVNYLGLAALFWFIGVYTGVRNRLVSAVVIGMYLLIAVFCFILPYPWVYTDIQLTSSFPPNIVISPWYAVEQVVTGLLLLVYTCRLNRR